MSEDKPCGKGHEEGKESSCCGCHSSPVNPSVVQNLDEMEFERSIFQAAIDNDVQKIIRFSNASSFNVNSTDNYGYSALHYAARNGNMEAAKSLVKLGADLNLQTDNLKATALHRAVTANKGEMVKYLLSIGSQTNIKDCDAMTPLDRAVKEKREQITQMLQSFSCQKR